ncbi:reverse transcriptase domain-containing protein [Tanacetum coccineum]
MSTHEQHTPTVPTSAVRNTGGRSVPQRLEEPMPDEVLRELCDKNYHQLLPLIAKKMQKEKEQQDKLNAETSEHSKSEDSEGGHWKSKSRRHGSNTHEDDLSRPWTCEERNPFIPRIRHFNFPRTRMPSHVKTYDGSGDPKDHLKLFQAAAKTERWAMPTWCHMFNSTLTGNARVWFEKLPRESIDSYEYLRITFRENYLQQTKHIKDPVEIHHIKQRDGESTEDFMERYKAEILNMEGASECMKISGFMHGEVAAFSHSRKKTLAPWKQPEGGNNQNFKKGFKNKKRSDRKPDRFSILTKTPKKNFALEKGKFKAPPPMHGRMHAAEEADRRDDQVRQIVAIHQRIKAERQAKGTKEGGNSRKRQAPSHLNDSTMGDGGQTKGHPEFLSGDNNPFSVFRRGRRNGRTNDHRSRNRRALRTPDVHGRRSVFRSSIRTLLRQAPAINKKPDDPSYHITHRIQWRNHLADRSPSQHNGIIGRTGIRKIRAVPSTAHEMLKFPIKRGTVTIQSSRVIPMECAMIFEPSTQHPVTSQVLEEKIKVAILPEYPEQTTAIGSTLTEKGRKELCVLLRQNLDVFA